MCAVLHAPLHGLCQERQRELQLGSGRTCHDARLRGHYDALCPGYLLRHSRDMRHRVRLSDLRQDEHGRRRHHQVNHAACRRVPVPYRGVLRFPGLLRLPHITLVSGRS